MRRAIYTTVLMLAPILLLGQSQAPLRNEEIVKMFQEGLPENVIAAAIKVNDTNFDVSPDQLVALHHSGLPASVLLAMLEVGGPKRRGITSGGAPAIAPLAQPGPALTPAIFSNPLIPGAISDVHIPGALVAGGVPQPPREATVTLLLENGPQVISTERLETVRTTPKTSRVGSLFSNGTQDVSMMFMAVPVVGIAVSGMEILRSAAFHGGSGAATTYLWGLPGGSSSNAVPSSQPKFEVKFADIAGVNPDEFEPRIVKLNPTKDNWRLVGVTHMKETPSRGPAAPAWPSYSAFLEESVPAKKEITAPGRVTIIPEQRLEAGQYAIVLRPAFKDKKFSAEGVAKNQGEGVLFNSAWSFTVGSETPAPKAGPEIATAASNR